MRFMIPAITQLVFEQDLIEAEKEIVISSPGLTQEKVSRFTYLMKPRQESGIKITVITEDRRTLPMAARHFPIS